MKTKTFPTWNQIYTAPKNNKLFPMLIFTILMGLLFLAVPQLIIEHELVKGIEWANHSISNIFYIKNVYLALGTPYKE